MICGIDFSGASDAGSKIWLARGVIEGKLLRIEDCRRAENLPGSGRKRDNCLRALVEFIGKEKGGLFGLDFPFGLPKPLVKERNWSQFVAAFPVHYDSPEEFRKACWSAAAGKELKRSTDIENQTPFSPYNLRLYRQTYFGISKVLNPFVRDGSARILPMQKPSRGKPVILEVCPASSLKRKNLYLQYKGKSELHKRTRQLLLQQMERTNSLKKVKSSIRKRIVEDQGGDALDSVIAALATFHAVPDAVPRATENRELYMIEGHVYT